MRPLSFRQMLAALGVAVMVTVMASGAGRGRCNGGTGDDKGNGKQQGLGGSNFHKSSPGL